MPVTAGHKMAPSWMQIYALCFILKRRLFSKQFSVILPLPLRSMDGADLCFEIVKRADAGFVYSEAVAR